MDLKHSIIIFMCLGFIYTGCEETDIPEDEVPLEFDLSNFPEFVTPNSDYYTIRIGEVPEISSDSYRLIVSGALEYGDTLDLEALYQLDQTELLLTVECISNPANGLSVSTARWQGFDLYEFLMSRGMYSTAEAVQFRCADNYFASYTIDQIREKQVLAALFMNGDTLPALHGYPLRILIPGLYGVKQPAWVTEIEVLEFAGQDFWDQYGWDTSPPIATDSKILFPTNSSQFTLGDTVQVGGTAFGDSRISEVQLSINGGETWQATDIVKQVDSEQVWVFWASEIIFPDSGEYSIYTRAIDVIGNIQPEIDNERLDGVNNWPHVQVTIHSEIITP
ncbi:MAG: molybdopterin-dependent oxidoreductase [Candidatus Marinimicrobia bacterium]|jgi:DMSO/TMAO reductase YedYZ molybdopterin-dependent catalytic subunit|nr:molybdopterin-dependent oxidoreductase [Candidatus Neomarinimicrobiota bacterium]MBT4035029.1 molybdopterin-dependent oxidoreductase [Candidatus Neomarinimicrobiota bacterium]MBT4361901.1 molybdopterin-dependent oxidoreductase [Candidatus Neomarinimicrobiota bacterium]MBT4714640.1 molybdopterin-dependent oxidoreductase [Candidatus Neomarinimicrobiota bacterium]MBT4945757.1 molybdopterin-dependent oxidoreductase [Candidatus Neomarinimicrobiota bacterium]